MLGRIFLFALFSVSLLPWSLADTLAIERFELPIGTLHDTGSGYGWAPPITGFENWHTQGFTGDYQVDDTDIMIYPQVSTAGNYCSGGAYRSTGRYFDVDGAFGDFENNGRIGSGSFYFSFLIRKEENTDDSMQIVFSDGNEAWSISDELIKIGYFGATSNGSGGERYWSLAAFNESSLSLSDSIIRGGETYRMVVEINFDATTFIRLWVNPPIDELGDPDAVVSSAEDLGFWNMVLFFDGGLPDQGSFDEFIFSDDLGNVLPVEYTELYSNSVDGGVELHWTTATEISNDYYVIERLSEEGKWNSIGEIDGNGDSSELNSYFFLDKSPSYGVNFYRLVQVDYNGDRHVSEIVSESLHVDYQLNVDAFQKGGELHFLSNSEIREISISDLAGRDVHRYFTNQRAFSIALWRREKSIYLVIVKSINGVWRQKILIQ